MPSASYKRRSDGVKLHAEGFCPAIYTDACGGRGAVIVPDSRSS